MKIGEPYLVDRYNCAHGVATEYRSIGVDLGDAFDCDLWGLTFVRRIRKLFHQVDKPQDWDLVVMTKGRTRHIGVIRYGRVKHNEGHGASGAVVSNDLGYISRLYPNTTFWRLNDQRNILPDRRWGKGVK